MTQYLVRKIHHTTDEVFLDATKAKDNETFVVVDAESKEEALSWYKEHKERTDWKSIDKKTKRVANKPKGLLEVIPSSFNDNSVSIAAIKSCMFVEKNEKGE